MQGVTRTGTGPAAARVGWPFGLVWLGAVALSAASEPATLRETAQPGQATQVVVEMTAEGLYQPAPPPGAEQTAAPIRPYPLKVEARLAYRQRVWEVGPDGEARRVVRWVDRAGVAIGGEVLPATSALRPEVALLVAEPREGAVVTYSLGGPLTRAELDLVQTPGDPLLLVGFLPETPVAVGDRWTVSDRAARGVSGYDALATNSVQATLEALDDAEAVVRLAGEIRGASLGGEGVMRCEGSLTFDRKAGVIRRLELNRDEQRKPGPVEAGLDIQSTLRVNREPVAVPPELSDEVLSELPSGPQPYLELVLFEAPDGKYRLLHNRYWHIFLSDTRQTVFKRLDGGELVAQCNLAYGPNAGKGRHQDPNQFRDEVRQALGRRFGRFLGAGEVEGAPAGHFRYRVAVQGQVGEVGVLWFYYLVASPEGDQLVATFTLGAAQAEQFGGQDLEMIGSLEWLEPESPSESE